MTKFIKLFLTVVGGILVGFGSGMIMASALTFAGLGYWLILILSLVLGGFLIAVGFMGKTALPISEEGEIIHSDKFSQDPPAEN